MIPTFFPSKAKYEEAHRTQPGEVAKIAAVVMLVLAALCLGGGFILKGVSLIPACTKGLELIYGLSALVIQSASLYFLASGVLLCVLGLLQQKFNWGNAQQQQELRRELLIDDI